MFPCFSSGKTPDCLLPAHASYGFACEATPAAAWLPQAQVMSEGAALERLGSTKHAKMAQPVMFYGTLEFAWVLPGDMASWEEGCRKRFFKKACTRKPFVAAVQQACGPAAGSLLASRRHPSPPCMPQRIRRSFEQDKPWHNAGQMRVWCSRRALSMHGWRPQAHDFLSKQRCPEGWWRAAASGPSKPKQAPRQRHAATKPAQPAPSAAALDSAAAAAGFAARNPLLS